MKYVAEVDQAACLGHGDCALSAPTVFLVEEIAEIVGEGAPEAILEAAQVCPAGAITVLDGETGEQVYP